MFHPFLALASETHETIPPELAEMIHHPAPLAASPENIVIGVVLGLIGLIILLAMLVLILSPLRKLFVSQKDKNRLKYAFDQLVLLDERLEQGDARGALKFAKNCFIFEVISDPHLLRPFREHHQNVLSRCLIIGEDLGKRPEHLGAVEKLYLQRTELMELLIKARGSYKSLDERRTKDGKGIPSWSRADFETRIAQIQLELTTNLKEIKSELEALLRALSSEGESGITYH